MLYPEHFYYFLSQSDINYQTYPGVRPNLNRLIAGCPDFWVAPTGKLKIYPKKLVLDKTVFQDYTKAYVAALDKLIKQLMEEKFEIYLPLQKKQNESQEHMFRHLTSEAWNKLCDDCLLDRISELEDWTSYKILPTSVLNQEQILYLDDQAIRSIPSFIPPQLSNESKQKEITKSCLDLGSEASLPALEHLLLQNVIITENLKEKIKKCINLTKISFEDCVFDQQEDFLWIPDYVTELVVQESQLPTHLLIMRLVQLHNLRHLMLYDLKDFNKNKVGLFEPLQPFELRHLKSLDINYQQLNLVQYCPGLLSLKMRSTESELSFDNVERASFNLPHLTSIHFDYSMSHFDKNISLWNQKLINAAPNLQNELLLDRFTLHKLNYSYGHIHKLIILEVEEINSQLMKSIIKHFPQLKSVTFVRSSALYVSEEKIDENMDNLLYDSDIDTVVDKLTLSVTNEALSYFKKLPLKELSFSATAMDFNDVTKILNSCKQLETISFSKNYLFITRSLTIQSHYPKLTKLIFDNCISNAIGETFDANYLLHFTKNAPNLSHIDVTDCSPSFVKTSNDLCTPNLQVKHFSYGNNLKNTELVFILQLFPKLITFNVDYINWDNQYLDLNKNQLPYLATFQYKVLYNAPREIYLKNIQTLLEAAPNLTQKTKNALKENYPIAKENFFVTPIDNNSNDQVMDTVDADTIDNLVCISSAQYPISDESQLDRSQSNKELSAESIANNFNYQETYTVDADTTLDENKTINTLRIFSPLDDGPKIGAPAYRINIYDTLSVSSTECSISDAFQLSHSQPRIMRNVSIVKAENLESIELYQILPSTLQNDLCDRINQKLNEADPFEYLCDNLEFLCENQRSQEELQKAGYFNNQNILKELKEIGRLIQGQFTVPQGLHPLPSLAAHEQILFYHTSNNTELTFQYSDQERLYYVDTKIETKITYCLFIYKLEQNLSNDIVELSNRLNTFSAKKLLLDSKKKYTGLEYLNLIDQQQVGACRHRAILFKYLMQQYHPEIGCWVVRSNSCHMYVEVEQGEYRIKMDLGGYSQKINYINEKKNIDTDETLNTKSRNKRNPSELIQEVPLNKNLAIGEQLKLQFQSKLETWKTLNNKVKYLNEYIEDYIKLRPHNRLIECEQLNEIRTLRYGFQKYFISKHPVFYIHQANDLCWPSLTLNDDGTGTPINRPTGSLYEFLTQNKTGILIINYSTFSSQEYVQCNELLDDTRTILGVPIPSGMNIIGLKLNTKSSFKPGNDFYSRFDVVESFPLAAPEEPNFPPEPTHEESAISAQPYSIDLFKSPDWEVMLLGQWLPHEGDWIYQPGALLQALGEGIEKINIKNGPWNNDNFYHFWHQAQLQGFIQVANKKIDFKNIQLTQSHGYAEHTVNIAPLSQNHKILKCLNSISYEYFFNRYRVVNERLTKCAGWIEDAKNENNLLQILLTEELSRDAWAKFIHHVQHYQVNLEVAVAPGIKYPDGFSKPHEESYYKITLRNTQLIETNDLDAVVLQQWETESSSTCIIDISECHAYELIDSIDAFYDKSTQKFDFKFKKGFITRQLNAGAHVILKGTFSQALAFELADFIAQDHPNLYLISNDLSAFSFVEKRFISVDKKNYLIQKLKLNNWPEFLSPALLEEESFAQLLTRINYYQRTKDQHTENAWQGMHSLSNFKTPDISDFRNEEKSTNFTQMRQKTINDILETQPFVYITGLSGVGKSTFIKYEFLHNDDRLYIEEAKILDWIMDTKPGRKILFIDEANLKNSQWTLFEGLFLPSPAIFYEGEYYSLSPEHKVIFAGNPLNFGDERILASLFERHGNAVVFEPLPGAVIYQNILRPVFSSGMINPTEQVKICSILLKFYQEISQHSEHELLISPRELQMLALLTSNTFTYYSKKLDVSQIFNYYAYYFMKNIMSADRFNTVFSHITAPVLPITPPRLDKHTLTASHEHLYFILTGLLHLRHTRRTSNLKNDAENYGGLGGLLLEGEPGIGKTQLILSVLEHYKIQKLDLYREQQTNDDGYYHVTNKLSLEERENKLREAFIEGRVVIIDELNSSPLMERLLNSLLMGSTPEGTRPKKPGFCLIATQNPSNMPGRRVLSSALKRRLICLEAPIYSVEELQVILENRGILKQEAKTLSVTFHDHLNYAKNNHLNPRPCVRDVLKIAEELLQTSSPQENKRFKSNNSRYRLFSENNTGPSPHITPDLRLA